MTKHGLLNDEWMVSYAAGALSEAKSLVVASHIAFHPDLQEKVADAEAIGGALLDEVEPVRLRAGALEDILDVIDNDDVPTTQAEPRESELPAPLRDYLSCELDDLKWQFMGPGMKKVRLKKYESGECLWLLRARGGTEMPLHDHRGTEFTLVLRGSYAVGDKRFTPGLMELAGPELKNHSPIIDEGEDCICLVVTDAPIRLHSVIGRMVQPFIGL
ncbi:ChrR family anti-sigma-E factor [Kordiimonas sp.]|uniref:ChrR family anti-sigma-E factor n=1 Tax=Kordiimonas sp. TaxID=1970157 RepID=UPI003A8E8073